MVDWKSSKEIASNQQTLNYLQHLWFGIFLYEFISTLGYEYKFIIGKKKFKWPVIFYFAGRYMMLAFFITFMVNVYAPKDKPIHCTAIWVLLTAAGQFTRGFASINFAVRTMAVWNYKLFVMVLLWFMIVCHWVVPIYNLVLTKATWVPGVGCLPSHISTKWSIAFFTTCMALDLTVLVLNAWKIGLPFKELGKKSNFQYTLFKHGLIFYIVAITFDLVNVILFILDLNGVMDNILTTPDVLVCMILSSRAVRELIDFNSPAGSAASQTMLGPSALMFSKSSGTQGISGQQEATGPAAIDPDQKFLDDRESDKSNA